MLNLHFVEMMDGNRDQMEIKIAHHTLLEALLASLTTEVTRTRTDLK